MQEVPRKMVKNGFQWEIGFLVKATSALHEEVKLGQDHF